MVELDEVELEITLDQLMIVLETFTIDFRTGQVDYLRGMYWGGNPRPAPRPPRPPSQAEAACPYYSQW